jgi:hypothetical protein
MAVMKKTRRIVIGLVVTVAALSDVAEKAEVVRAHLPGWAIAHSQGAIIASLIALIAYLLFSYGGEDKNAERPTINMTGSTATATGNVMEMHQHFDLPLNLVSDLAAAVAEKLKAGMIGGISAEDEADAQTPPRLSNQDGFIQLEGVNLDVTAMALEAGHSVTSKYFYANRGTLPVYEVQTWGLMQVLDPSVNSGPLLKAVMIAAAKAGHEKYPGAATLGVQLKMHSLARLSEPFTNDQLTALEQKRMSLFLLIGGVWVDNHGAAHFWAACQMAEFYDGLSWERFNWKNL